MTKPPKKIHPSTDLTHFFSTDHLRTHLKKHSIRGGAVTMSAQFGKFILHTGSTVVLARLLTPDDYGLIGMVIVVIGFVQLFKDLGLSTAIVQRAEINHQQVSTLFWINVALGCLIALVVAASSPVVAWFYNEPRLTEIMLVLASIFIFGGLTVQHQALLKRQMRFGSLAKIDMTSQLFGVVAAVTSAWLGAGYWALVIMYLTTALVNATGVWLVCRWRPGLPSWKSNIGSMLAYGGNLTGSNCFNYFSRNLDNILIGRYWGSQELGFYTKAYQLVLLPLYQINAPMTSVALPALSRLQGEPQQYCRYYYKAILLIATLGMPVIAFLFVAADKVISVMLGQQWLEVVPIFYWLMPAAFIGTFSGVATGWVYTSLSKTDRLLYEGIVTSAINVIFFLIFVRWGAIGVAAAFSLSQLILLVPRIFYCYQGTPLKLTDLASTLSRPTVASIGAAAMLMEIHQLASYFKAEVNVINALLIDCVCYSLIYFLIWMVLPKGKHILLEMLSILRFLKRN